MSAPSHDELGECGDLRALIRANCHLGDRCKQSVKQFPDGTPQVRAHFLDVLLHRAKRSRFAPILAAWARPPNHQESLAQRLKYSKVFVNLLRHRDRAGDAAAPIKGTFQGAYFLVKVPVEDAPELCKDSRSVISLHAQDGREISDDDHAALADAVEQAWRPLGLAANLSRQKRVRRDFIDEV